MPLTATVTAKTGPERQATAMVISNMTGMAVLPDRKVLTLYANGDEPGNVPAKEFDLTGVTTFTVAISGNNWTLTVS